MLAFAGALAAVPRRLSQGLARRIGLSRKSAKNNLARTFAASTSGRCLVRELHARKIPYRYLLRDQITNPRLVDDVVLEFHINGIPYYFTNEAGLRVADQRGIIPGRLIDGDVPLFVKRKDLVNAFLLKRGLSVPKGRAFSRNASPEAEAFFNSLCASVPKGVCVKPTNGSKGERVNVGVRDLESFRKAFSDVGESYPRVLLEETVQGPVYRFTIVAGRVCMVEYMRPANVEGDGVHTVAELVELKNKERHLNPTHFALQLGEREVAFLSNVGVEPQSIPEPGTLIFLSNRSNCHQGGDCIGVTERVHQSYIQLLENVVRLFPGFVLCGMDVAIPDICRAVTTDSYHILELNACPGFSTCHHPWHGEPRNIAGAILDYLLETSAQNAATPGRSQRPRRSGSGRSYNPSDTTEVAQSPA